MVYGAGHSNLAGRNAGYLVLLPNEGYMSMIGLLRNGTWSLYSQQFEVQNNTLTAFEML